VNTPSLSPHPALLWYILVSDSIPTGDSDMTRTVLTLILLLAAPLIRADVLLIEQVRQVERMDVPENGQTQKEVEDRFGAPLARSEPVGQPPITRWDYEHWNVYFEYDRVLFTVLHKGEVIQKDSSGA